MIFSIGANTASARDRKGCNSEHPFLRTGCNQRPREGYHPTRKTDEVKETNLKPLVQAMSAAATVPQWHSPVPRLSTQSSGLPQRQHTHRQRQKRSHPLHITIKGKVDRDLFSYSPTSRSIAQTSQFSRVAAFDL